MNIAILSRTIFLLAALAAAGCSILPEARPVQLLDPRIDADRSAADEPAAWTLSVARPETDPARDSARMLVRTSTGQLKVHPSARWIAPAPELLRTLLIRFLRDSGTFEQVGASSAGSDRTLAIDLRRFELDETGGMLAATLQVDARIYGTRSATLTARRLFEFSKPVDSSDAETTVAGFESVLTEAADGLAAWLTSLPPPGDDG